LAGKTVIVAVLPEEQPATYYVAKDDFPLLIDPQGHYWNDYRPVRPMYTAREGRVWRFPRRWLYSQASLAPNREPDINSSYQYQREVEFGEMLCLPSF